MLTGLAVMVNKNAFDDQLKASTNIIKVMGGGGGWEGEEEGEPGRCCGDH